MSEPNPKPGMLPEETLRYNRLAVIHRIYATVLYQFVKSGATTEQIASRLHWKKADVVKMLTHPEKWTLSIVSDLLLAMDAEAEDWKFRAFPPAERVEDEVRQMAP